MLFYRAIFIGILASSTAMASTSFEQFESCFRTCNNAFFESSQRAGDILPENEVYSRNFLEEMLQESLRETSAVCMDAEFQLMADALCFYSDNGICNVGHIPKPVELPPFLVVNPEPDELPSYGMNLKSAPGELLELIGNRELTTECIEAFIL